VLGVGPHQDGTFITILKQDDNVSGLQVYKGPGDEMNIDPTQWVTIPPVKNALVVNVGAMLEVWSNLKYKAALHRVIANNNLPRYSVPFFYTPSYDTVVCPILQNGETPKYRDIQFGDYRRLLYSGFYKEIPIEKQARLPNYRI